MLSTGYQNDETSVLRNDCKNTSAQESISELMDRWSEISSKAEGEVFYIGKHVNANHKKYV